MQYLNSVHSVFLKTCKLSVLHSLLFPPCPAEDTGCYWTTAPLPGLRRSRDRALAGGSGQRRVRLPFVGGVTFVSGCVINRVSSQIIIFLYL